jgi:hypothetical protein
LQLPSCSPSVDPRHLRQSERRSDALRGWTVLTDELQRYEYEIHPGGRISYDAPGGFHDDCVVAPALANALHLPCRSLVAMNVLSSVHKTRTARLGPRVLNY